MAQELNYVIQEHNNSPHACMHDCSYTVGAYMHAKTARYFSDSVMFQGQTGEKYAILSSATFLSGATLAFQR